MVGIYFSGTGNTKHCVETFVKTCDETAPVCSIEAESSIPLICRHHDVVFGYPVQFSSLPKLVRDFIDRNSSIWRHKRVFVLATMGLFSGDGAGVLARLLRSHGATVVGGLHLKMPDSIGDEKALKRSLAANRALVQAATAKVQAAAQRYQEGRPPQEGLGPLSHLAGLLGQRLYFSYKTKRYSNRLNIDSTACTGCGKCVRLCPMDNIRLQGQHALPGNRCTMCYRCVSHCPAQAITLLGKRVIEQCYLEKYL